MLIYLLYLQVLTSKLVMKHGMKFTDFKSLKMEEADELQLRTLLDGL